ncbi:MAG: cyclic nucleotide-binding domain-containing protein [Nannocystaceae bacterium]|nr:cyclic nucleotide-binding domain-containing protein [Nannocystaceae bacterium]
MIKALKGITLFDGLLPLHLERIAALVQEVQFKKNDAVFSHGDDGDGLYLIMEGAVRISRSVAGMGEEALAILQPGMYFGEMSIVDDDVPRSADAIAHEDTRLLKLPKDDLRDLMFVDRELAYELLWRFVRTLSTRLRDSNDRLLMLTVSSKF